MKAIETSYNGYHFRSRTEARWAVFMDALNIPYVYEPEGIVFDDGTTYLPDFYLPDQDAFLECKGIMSEKDEDKIKHLVLARSPELIVGYSDMKFDVYARWWKNPDIIYKGNPWLMECFACKKRYFINADMNPDHCRCCENVWTCDDDESTFTRLLYSGKTGTVFDGGGRFKKIDAVDKAKSARFEFGEEGAK